MKTHFLKLILAAAMPLWLCACEDFTEVDLPQTQLPGEVVFQDAATANAALADIYARLRETGFASGNNISATMLLGNYADELDFYGSNTDIEQCNKHLLLPSNSVVAQIWSDTYAQIYAINALYQGVQKSTAITSENRDRLLGEALFMRAFLHFHLINVYGDVPYLKTTDYKTNATVSKTPQAQAYALVLADLELAEELLPTTYPSADRVRANKAVATALKARVYLYTNNWSEAESHASALINNPDYSYEPNPERVFLKDSPAIIWSLHPGIAGLNTNDARTFAISDGPPFKPTLSENLYHAFEANDLRKTLWIKTVADGEMQYYQPFKYKQEANTPTSEEYTIVLRLEEQYLIRAEARAHLGDITGAQSDLNKSRNRAGFPDTTANTTTQLLVAILNERRFELFTEQGHRWFDLKRTGNATTALAPIKPNWQDTDLLWPVPATELVLNNNLLPQNPGY